MKSLLLFCSLFLLISCSSEDSNRVLSEEERWEAHAANCEIIRDNYGVPHIYGKTDADAVFGMLYAQCEDDFNRVERNYIWAIGRLAEVEGQEALYSDLRARLFMTREEAIEKYENSPDWLKKLCLAFADGINFYLKTHPEVKPKLLTRFEPWMPMYFSEGSIGGDIEHISVDDIREFYGSENQELKAWNNGLMRLDDNEPRGSNGFAISGARTKSGNAMLLINPHTSFFFRGEIHVVSEEGLNAYGATTWGQFFVYQGFNEKTGWMHTSTHADFMDEYLETVIEDSNSIQYLYDNERRDMWSQQVELKYKDGNEVKTREFEMYRTHHGPITGSENGKWISTAMMWDPVKALEQSFTRTKKNGHKEFRKMMDIRTNSSNNTVYADAQGNIAYYHGNFMPKRDTNYDYRNPVDGSISATDWKGLHTVDENILVVNPKSGWIQNCNSTPFTSAGENSPKAYQYPKYMSANQENFRGIHAVRLLKDAKNLTLDKLIELAYDPKLPAYEVLIPGLIEAYDKIGSKNKELGEIIEQLRGWDCSVTVESVSMTVAHFYALDYLKSGDGPKNGNFMQRIEYMGKESSYKERLMHLTAGVARLKKDFGTWKTEWGTYNRYQRINGNRKQAFNDALPSTPIGMASGWWGALASFGARAYDGTVKQYGTSGNSFVAVVEFGDKVKAKTLLAGGQSGDPASPHFDDQVENYAKFKFKDVPYYKKDVDRRAKAKYHPGEKWNP